MVNREQLREICDKYGLDSKKIIKNNENVIEKADYTSICYVLDYLKDTLKITSNNIEKCPSILYLNVGAIKENWRFLNEQKIHMNDVETCLHILSTEPKQLKETYKYVSDENRYGKKYIEQITSILRVPVERIQEIEERCPELTKNNVLSAANSRRTIQEIEEIIKVCKENGIEATGSVFMKSAKEIEEIIKVCNENGIEITGSIFKKSPKQLKENIEFIKQNYGEEYLTPLIISKNLKNFQKILPYLQSIGVLETVKNSASILSLTLEEIQERQAFAEKIGEPIVKNGRFNSIFGLSRKNYQKKVKEFAEKQELIGEIKGAIQEGKILDEQISGRKKERNNGR